MRKPPIILVIMLAMTGLAYAFAPVLAPVPPSAVTGAACIPAAGSAPGTAVHGSLSDDVGIIVDAVNDMAYEAYIVNSAYLRIAQSAADAIESKLTEAEPSGLIGFKTWISVKWQAFKDFLAQPGELEKHPALDAAIGQYYSPGALPPVAAGETFAAGDGGYYTALSGQLAAGNFHYTSWENDVKRPCSVSPEDDTWMTFTAGPYYSGSGPIKPLFLSKTGQMLPNGQTFQTLCKGGPDPKRAGYILQYSQSWRYVTTWSTTPLPEERTAPPGVWNPAVDDALNADGINDDPAIKGEICDVIKDNPDLVNPIIDKLTINDLASYAADNAAALQGNLIEELTAKVAADPTDVASQNALNDALTQAAAQQAQELQKEAVVAASLPDVIAEERRQIDWTPLSQLIGQGCAKVDKDDCPFPFDFIYSLGRTFDEFQSEHPSMVDPSGSYGFDNFKIDFNFDFSRFTETMAKIRLLLSWVMTIYTIHKCVRIVTRDNAAGGDDD